MDDVTRAQIDTSAMGYPPRSDSGERMKHYQPWDGDVLLCTSCGSLVASSWRPEHDRLHDRLDAMGTVSCRACLGAGRIAVVGGIEDCGACRGDGWL